MLRTPPSITHVIIREQHQAPSYWLDPQLNRPRAAGIGHQPEGDSLKKFGLTFIHPAIAPYIRST